jgi:hypothetical protein
MTVTQTAQHFDVRHRVIDQLRGAREQGLPLAASQADVEALLDEVDQLQLVAHAANNFTPFALCGLEEAQTVLRDALQAWKA